jgi:RNA polymerase sigma-70 factor (ECF subfamily)
MLSEAFERIFREHSEFVYCTAYRVTGRVEDAEDVLQTIFVQLLRQEQPPAFQQNPKAYLYRAAVNTSLNVIRSRKRSVLTDDIEVFESPEAWRQSASDERAREELRAVMTELSERSAQIFLLRHVHGYSDKEIAQLLGISRGTVAVTLFRARARLRKSMRRKSGGKS